MDIFNRISFLNEGQQRDEHVRKRQDEKDKLNLEKQKRVGTLIKKHIRLTDNQGGYNTSAKNPKFDKARKIQDYRYRHPGVLPSRLTSEEKKLEKARRLDDAAERYAKMQAHRFNKTDMQGNEYSVNLRNPDYLTAYDAAFKHYKKLHRESTIFDKVKFL